MKNQNAYTALELLIAIAIIAMLSAILLPAISSSQRKANTAKTKAMIESLGVAIESYRSTFGAYPPEAEILGTAVSDSSESVYYHTGATFVAGNNTSQAISAGPFMEFRKKSLGSTSMNEDMDGLGPQDDAVYEITDPWGGTYLYENPGTYNTSSFDLSSAGPDGVAGNGDDATLNNWD